MNRFEYASPSTLTEALALLTDTWGQTEILAGGTDLITSLKQNLTTPRRVVSLKAVSDLKKIEVRGTEVRIGAMTSLAELSAHPAIRQHFPSLVEAVEGIASPQIIAMGTVGGDLCQRPRCWYYRQGFGLLAQQEGRSMVPEGDNRYHAIYGNKGPAYFVSPSSLAPGLIALGAALTLAAPPAPAQRVEPAAPAVEPAARAKRREVKCQAFFRVPQAPGERETDLRPNEILTEITIPLRGLRNSTYEVRHRKSLDWPLVTASVAFDYSADVIGIAKRPRRGFEPPAEPVQPAARAPVVVLGHVAPVPWVSERAAALLDGKSIDESVAAQCGEAAASGATPLSRNGYKVQLVKVAVKRALLAASGKKG